LSSPSKDDLAWVDPAKVVHDDFGMEPYFALLLKTLPRISLALSASFLPTLA